MHNLSVADFTYPKSQTFMECLACNNENNRQSPAFQERVVGYVIPD